MKALKTKKMMVLFIAGIVLGLAGGLYCYFFFQFWTHKDSSGFKALKEFKGGHIKAHLGRQILVHKDFYPMLNQLDTLAEENNVKILITSSYRYADKKISNQVVRPAKTSNHLAGYAIDLNIKYKWKLFESVDLRPENLENLSVPVQEFIQALRYNANIRWGGDFNTPDPVHVDIPLNKTDMERWKQYHNSCFFDYANAKPKWRAWINNLFKRL
ncbi:MAG: M15 family metallopeptidase [Desulfobacteraceae bacterium]|nr:M15 family metallopeptidase [Desulfobacteraceae bacterium]